MTELDTMGFDPEVAIDDDVATIAFAHCPFGELAEANPGVVCALHQGHGRGLPRRHRRPLPVRSTASSIAPLPGRAPHPCLMRSFGCHAPATRYHFSVDRLRRTPRDHAHGFRCRQGQAAHRGRGRHRRSRCGWRSVPAAARASATRCSSTPTWPTTTSPPSTPASRSCPTRRAPSSSNGATLDYKDGIQDAGFAINNPNASRTCGCGQSFS
jgi:hypothetical protein